MIQISRGGASPFHIGEGRGDLLAVVDSFDPLGQRLARYGKIHALFLHIEEDPASLICMQDTLEIRFPVIMDHSHRRLFNREAVVDQGQMQDFRVRLPGLRHEAHAGFVDEIGLALRLADRSCRRLP